LREKHTFFLLTNQFSVDYFSLPYCYCEDDLPPFAMLTVKNGFLHFSLEDSVLPVEAVGGAVGREYFFLALVVGGWVFPITEPRVFVVAVD